MCDQFAKSTFIEFKRFVSCYNTLTEPPENLEQKFPRKQCHFFGKKKLVYKYVAHKRAKTNVFMILHTFKELNFYWYKYELQKMSILR